MIKSYKLKCYLNKQKAIELNKLLAFWQDKINHKIKTFWELKDIGGNYPSKEYCRGGRLTKDASIKAWQIVKGAKKTNQISKPFFNGKEIDLNQASAYIVSDLITKEFDIWFSVINLNLGHRLKIPCKKTKIFNEAVAKGKLKKSFKLIKINGNYYIECYVDFPEIKKENSKLIGIDVGLNNAVATSDGKILGQGLKDLRMRTKHRIYKKKLSPTKQKLNHYARKVAIAYPDTDFVVEDLLFKGKKGRSKEFRRRNNKWAYNQLANKLEEMGKLEGFRLIKVNPTYSSQKCPVCGFTNKANRQGVLFLCKQCGYMGDADIVGAINLVKRVAQKHSVSERYIFL